jgi:hypothetical protein
MKLSEIDVEPDTLGAEEDTTDPEDLLEALELLEACLVQMEAIIRMPRGRKVGYTQEKELIDLCIEVTGYLDQFEDREED